MKKSHVKIIIIAVVLVAIILSYYYYLSRKSYKANLQKKEIVGTYEKIVNKNLDKNYPQTPRSVVKEYNTIVKEFYDEKHSNQQIKKLANQARKLFDEELLKANSKDDYMNALTKDIRDFEKRKKTIVRFKVQSSSDVKMDKIKGKDIAYVETYYFIKEGKNYERTYQLFCLRKDQEGRWKILTWKVVEGDKDLFE